MRSRTVILTQVSLLATCHLGWGAALYVGTSGPSAASDGGRDAALTSIQAAIDRARDGDTVIVPPGRYVENIDFKGKAITVRSEDPEDADVVAATIIDGDGKGSVVTFNSREREGSVLSGFTITNGLAEFGGGIYCGPWTVPTILNNHIVENAAVQGGGGIYCWYSMTASRNVIAFNRADIFGAGILADFSSWPLVTSNLIVKNEAAQSGGGLLLALFCVARVINNTIVDNAAPEGGGGIYSVPMSDPDIWNCILWGNGDDLFGWGGRYCCVEDIGRENEGEGNIHLDPLFVNPALGDYHLLASSPCIGAGTTNAPSMPVFDFDGEAIPFGSFPDIGADEFVDSDRDRLPDLWEMKWFGDLRESAGGNPDSDQLSNENELVAATDPENPDTDGDGCLDGVEFFAGTDPLDPDSFFKILRLSLTGSLGTLRWTTEPGRWYRAYLSEDLQSWTPAGIALRATGDVLESSFLADKSIRVRFFKVKVLPE